MPVTASATAEHAPRERNRRERWLGKASLTRRILAVNIVALALLAASLFSLDNFRARLIEERRAQAEEQAQLVAAALAAAPRRARPQLIATLGKRLGNRIRVFDGDGDALLDSWKEGPRTYGFDRRSIEPWDTEGARAIDRYAERLVGARELPPFRERGPDAERWPELMSVYRGSTVSSRVRLAADRTLMISAATTVDIKRSLYVLSVGNARDVTRLVRAERFRLAILISATLVFSILLSLFLAQTIVRPLRRLAQAAARVRLGRSRDVTVPRMPRRSDEIGVLARAVSDMSLALRARIDATEAFAADVAHELKNPLASMASAVESLGRTSDPAISAQLRAIVADDVRRLDRAITDIAELSRIDAELSRARLEPVDVGRLLVAIIEARTARRRSGDGDVRLTVDAATDTATRALADESRLPRAIDNLIDNALSFSPPGGEVRVACRRAADAVVITVEDDGPGVAPDQREAIFLRFHSDRPDDDDGGQPRHSGLGLAIARAIIEGVGGTVHVEDASGGGARFVVRLPPA